MPRKQETSNATGRKTTDSRATTPDDFPDDLRGDFDKVPQQLAENIGAIAALTIAGGGYFGISVTDDGGSARLAIRHKSFELDRRFAGIGKLEGALAYCLRKLRDAE